MGNPQEAYLIRGEDGRMSTVMAFSTRGAIKIYMAKFPAKKGYVEIKTRGHGSWEAFTIR